MTEQEAFDLSVSRIVEQGEPSYKSYGLTGCKYRFKDGDKTLACAVGVLLEDSEYLEKMENKRVTNITDLLPERFLGMIPLLSALQDCHDRLAQGELSNEEFTRQFLHYANCVAIRHNLKPWSKSNVS